MKILLFVMVFLFSSCEEKSKPNISMLKDSSEVLSCLKLNTIGLESDFIETLHKLYTFDDTCTTILQVSYKKDIVCNSIYNVARKNSAKFPKSFLRMELREDFAKVYTYYIDLYSNVQSADIEEAFLQLKKDVL